MKEKKKIAILGCGNMTQAIFLPLDLKASGFLPFTYTPSHTKAADLAGVLEGEAIKKLSELPACDYYFIGCKPQQFTELAKELKLILPDTFRAISIMAAVKAAKIKELSLIHI